MAGPLVHVASRKDPIQCWYIVFRDCSQVRRESKWIDRSHRKSVHESRAMGSLPALEIGHVTHQDNVRGSIIRISANGE